MKFSSLIVPGLLTVLALAQDDVHQHHQHKRAVETVVVTELVSSYGQSVGVPAQPDTTSDATTATTAASGSASDVPVSSFVPSSSFSTVLVGSSSTNPTSSSSTSSSSSSATGSNEDLAFAEGAKGITYSPYTNQGTCKDAATVKSDIAKLSQFDVIRIYDTDCSGVENVLAGKTSSQKLFAGIYYISNVESSVKILIDAVEATSGGWDNIYAVSVGNELVQDGSSTPAAIKSAIATARTSLEAAGYSGSIVTVDTVGAYTSNTDLCEISDFIAVNAHPYFNGNVAPENAGSFLQSEIELLQQTCGSTKSILICESGWPTQGETLGTCVPSIANQKTAVESIVSAVGGQTLLFTTYNDYWKSPGTYGVEQYWGLLQN